MLGLQTRKSDAGSTVEIQSSVTVESTIMCTLMLLLLIVFECVHVPVYLFEI